MLARENHAPYQRPPLSKDLWFGRATLDELPVHPEGFYREQGVELLLRREAVELDPARHLLWDERGVEHGYDRLLLATGCRPRRLTVPGAEIDGLHYFRNLEDYVFLSRRLDRLEHVLVVGGGFIGSELAAALRHAGKEVTLLVDREYPLFRVLPRELGLAVAERFRREGIETVSEDKLVALEQSQGLVRAHTASGGVISTQAVVVGIGVEPEADLAEAAGLDVDDGIVVDEFARTSDPDIYAAGDVARYPCVPLGHSVRVEHWDHAREHGRCAGANLAGATEPYEGLPYFFSDLFDLGFEGVGDLDPGLRVETVWREPGRSPGEAAGGRRLLPARRHRPRRAAVERARRGGLGARPGARGAADVRRRARGLGPWATGGRGSGEGTPGLRGPAGGRHPRRQAGLLAPGEPGARRGWSGSARPSSRVRAGEQQRVARHEEARLQPVLHVQLRQDLATCFLTVGSLIRARAPRPCSSGPRPAAPPRPSRGTRGRSGCRRPRRCRRRRRRARCAARTTPARTPPRAPRGTALPARRCAAACRARPAPWPAAGSRCRPRSAAAARRPGRRARPGGFSTRQFGHTALGDGQDAQPRQGRADGRQGGLARRPRQVERQHQHGGPQAGAERDRLGGVRGQAYDLEILLRAEQHGERLAVEGTALGDHDAEAGCAALACGRRSGGDPGARPVVTGLHRGVPSFAGGCGRER